MYKLWAKEQEIQNRNFVFLVAPLNNRKAHFAENWVRQYRVFTVLEVGRDKWQQNKTVLLKWQQHNTCSYKNGSDIVTLQWCEIWQLTAKTYIFQNRVKSGRVHRCHWRQRARENFYFGILQSKGRKSTCWWWGWD